MSCAAIILAAGESRRMGSPKALLPFRGGTFLSVVADTLGTHCSPVVGVFGAQAARLMAQAPIGLDAQAAEAGRQAHLHAQAARLVRRGLCRVAVDKRGVDRAPLQHAR